MRPRQLRVRLAAMAFGAITAGWMLGAAPARADELTAQYTRDNAATFCGWLDRHPTDAGLSDVLGIIHDAGFTTADTAEIMVDTMAVWCPRNQPVIDTFIEHYSSATAVRS